MTQYCTKCQQPLTKMGPDNYLCPTHPDAGRREPTIVPKGGGHYEITVGGSVVKTVQGKAKAEAFAATL